jgi:hypothetical protein
MSELLKIILRLLAIVWIFAGMSYFYVVADFNYNPFSLNDTDYFFWDKTATVLLILCILIPYRRMNRLFYVLLSFCIIRALYEVPIIKESLDLDAVQMFYILCVHVIALVTVAIIDFIMEKNRLYERNLETYFTELYKPKK